MNQSIKGAKGYLSDAENIADDDPLRGTAYAAIAQAHAQIAQTHALIALVERLDRVMEHTHTAEDGHKFYNLQVQATTFEG